MLTSLTLFQLVKVVLSQMDCWKLSGWHVCLPTIVTRVCWVWALERIDAQQCVMFLQNFAWMLGLLKLCCSRYRWTFIRRRGQGSEWSDDGSWNATLIGLADLYVAIKLRNDDTFYLIFIHSMLKQTQAKYCCYFVVYANVMNPKKKESRSRLDF